MFKWACRNTIVFKTFLGLVVVVGSVVSVHQVNRVVNTISSFFHPYASGEVSGEPCGLQSFRVFLGPCPFKGPGCGRVLFT